MTPLDGMVRLRSAPFPKGCLVGSVIAIIAWFAVIALAFFVIFVRPQRRRVAAHRALVDRLKAGDQVITTGGVIGEVEVVEEAVIKLRIADGVVINIARGAVAQLIPDLDALAATGDTAEATDASAESAS